VAEVKRGQDKDFWKYIKGYDYIGYVKHGWMKRDGIGLKKNYRIHTIGIVCEKRKIKK